MLAEVGDWYKVRFHKRAKDGPAQGSPSETNKDAAGVDPPPVGVTIDSNSNTTTSAAERGSKDAEGSKSKEDGVEGGGAAAAENSEAGEAECVDDCNSTEGEEKGECGLPGGLWYCAGRNCKLQQGGVKCDYMRRYNWPSWIDCYFQQLHIYTKPEYTPQRRGRGGGSAHDHQCHSCWPLFPHPINTGTE